MNVSAGLPDPPVYDALVWVAPVSRVSVGIPLVVETVTTSSKVTVMTAVSPSFRRSDGELMTGVPLIDVNAIEATAGPVVSTAYVWEDVAVRTVRPLSAASVIEASEARPSPSVPFEADIPVRETVTVYADPDPLISETVGVPVMPVVETAKSAVPTPITSSENVARKRAEVVRELIELASRRVRDAKDGGTPSTATVTDEFREFNAESVPVTEMVTSPVSVDVTW